MTNEWRETGRGVVHPWLCDQFGHFSVRNYVTAFDEASFQIWSVLGTSFADMKQHGVITVIASTKYDFVKEMVAGQMLLIKSGFVKLGTKSAINRQKMFDADTGTLHAVNEAVEVFFDPETRKPAPMPDFFHNLIGENLVDPDGP